ncbi:uncharacterized protein BCR38DRAFT_148181 [Pseudomassariella vexata]|uniref:Uncharacterized protein n=1 Tax=Pseudomassariella vexata TaxID=1141098 RepID=A0A1Y2D5L3_9PEZI|nr:uncharacterized protein BCR38DRAFT_148181 [Pseudomassariella vexata]ORY54573.1 hypothetical protein BCR38DRAFT_148181 [Pseudomassariella vexata]
MPFPSSKPPGNPTPVPYTMRWLNRCFISRCTTALTRSIWRFSPPESETPAAICVVTPQRPERHTQTHGMVNDSATLYVTRKATIRPYCFPSLAKRDNYLVAMLCQARESKMQEGSPRPHVHASFQDRPCFDFSAVVREAPSIFESIVVLPYVMAKYTFLSTLLLVL